MIPKTTARDLKCIGEDEPYPPTAPCASPDVSQEPVIASSETPLIASSASLLLAQLAQERAKRQREQAISESIQEAFAKDPALVQKAASALAGEVEWATEEEDLSPVAPPDEEEDSWDEPELSDRTQSETRGDGAEEKDPLGKYLGPIREESAVRPAIILQGSSLHLRLEKRDFVKVRNITPFFTVGAEMVPQQVDAASEPFYRIKASEEQATLGFDTRTDSMMWLPIPLCLYGGRILMAKEAPFIFLASKSTTCKILLAESRTYPCNGTVKFEVDNIDPAERLLSTVIEEVQGAPTKESPSAGLDQKFVQLALQCFLTNPNDRMNQLGGGIVVLQAPSNTIRLKLSPADSISVEGVKVVAWTQGVRFHFSKTWFQCSRKLTHIRGPGTVWFAADRSVPNLTTPPKKLDLVE